MLLITMLVKFSNLDGPAIMKMLNISSDANKDSTRISVQHPPKRLCQERTGNGNFSSDHRDVGTGSSPASCQRTSEISSSHQAPSVDDENSNIGPRLGVEQRRGTSSTSFSPKSVGKRTADQISFDVSHGDIAPEGEKRSSLAQQWRMCDFSGHHERTQSADARGSGAAKAASIFAYACSSE